MFANSYPVRHLSFTLFLSIMLILVAIDVAVWIMSPVIIITLIPASLHYYIDLSTFGLGGSYIATIPIITESDSNFAKFFSSHNNLYVLPVLSPL